MSRSNNEEQLRNPSKRNFEWSGSKGLLTYYDKEQKEDIEVKLPFTFLVLDELTSIGGFNKERQLGYYSNEVKNLNGEPLNVRCGKESVEIGLYSDIKDSLKSKGCKYVKSVYIAFKDESGAFQIGRIFMKGVAFGGGEHKVKPKEIIKIDGWIDFCKKVDVYKGAVKMELETRECVNGASKFFAPKFSLVETSAETNEVAVSLDKELQDYLKVYLKQPIVREEEAAPAVTEETPIVSQRERIIAEQNAKNENSPEFEDLNEGFDGQLPF